MLTLPPPVFPNVSSTPDRNEAINYSFFWKKGSKAKKAPVTTRRAAGAANARVRKDQYDTDVGVPSLVDLAITATAKLLNDEYAL